MPLPARLYDLLMSGADPAQFATRGCLYPRPLQVRDMFGNGKTIVQDCGHCIRCCDEVRNQWATRMYLHSISDGGYNSPWKFCYFVTLTYGSYDLNQFKKHPFLDDWLATFPSLDRYNENRRYSWCPSVLVLSHVQNYLKRLRKVLAVDDITLSYAYCGEYGKTWGRCHWHLVLWTTKEVKKEVFSNAWGFDYVEQSADCFVSPRVTSNPADIKHFDIGEVYVDDLVASGAFTSHISTNIGSDVMSCFTYVAKYLRKEDDEVNEFAINRMFKAFCSLPVSDDDPDMKCRDLFYRNKNYKCITYGDFKKIFRPCFSSSARYALGKGYYLSNRSRFEKGDFTLPTFRGKELSFPRYYHYLLSNDRCPLYFEKVCMSGMSLVRSDFKIVREYFKELAINPYLVTLEENYSTSSFSRGNVAFSPDGVSLNYVCFRSSQYGTIRAYLNYEKMTFDFYRFSRTGRDYYLMDAMPVFAFCQYVIELLDAEEERVLSSIETLNKQLSVFNFINESAAAEEAKQRFVDARKKSQLTYSLTHKIF